MFQKLMDRGRHCRSAMQIFVLKRVKIKYFIGFCGLERDKKPACLGSETRASRFGGGLFGSKPFQGPTADRRDNNDGSDRGNYPEYEKVRLTAIRKVKDRKA